MVRGLHRPRREVGASGCFLADAAAACGHECLYVLRAPHLRKLWPQGESFPDHQQRRQLRLDPAGALFGGPERPDSLVDHRRGGHGHRLHRHGCSRAAVHGQQRWHPRADEPVGRRLHDGHGVRIRGQLRLHVGPHRLGVLLRDLPSEVPRPLRWGDHRDELGWQLHHCAVLARPVGEPRLRDLLHLRWLLLYWPGARALAARDQGPYA
mmetsp:Transcript_76016/g.170056  ORF Transcript_76016/g.170056 Transcript_76016/m.170056 type:complete len:209 (+) Transcript_76016:116-742(+)